MGDLFRLWRQHTDDNARRAVDAYQEEIPQYRSIAGSPHTRAELLDFAVFLRRRTVALAADNQPFGSDDLDFMAAMGRQRCEQGLSLAANRQVLLLHTRLTLRELAEAAGPHDLDATINALAWLSPAGLAAQGAYTRGFLEGQQRFLPAVTRLRQLVDMLVGNDVAAGQLADSLRMAIPDQFVVVVVRLAATVVPPDQTSRDESVGSLLRRHWLPISWRDPDEVVALLPSDETDELTATGAALALAQDVAAMVGRPCAAGTALALRSTLAEAVAAARQVCQVAPLRPALNHVYTVADVFAELGAARVPQVDQWLRTVSQRLAAGPDLVTTLDSYYHHDMNRTRAAAALHIHPRTLDYRLRRVRELTGLDPGSTQGIRVLSAGVTRILANP